MTRSLTMSGLFYGIFMAPSMLYFTLLKKITFVRRTFVFIKCLLWLSGSGGSIDLKITEIYYGVRSLLFLLLSLLLLLTYRSNIIIVVVPLKQGQLLCKQFRTGRTFHKYAITLQVMTCALKSNNSQWRMRCAAVYVYRCHVSQVNSIQLVTNILHLRSLS